MLTTVVAVLCSLATADCREEIVTDQVTFQQCLVTGQVGIAAWMSENPTYAKGWRLERYKCAPGGYKKARGI